MVKKKQETPQQEDKRHNYISPYEFDEQEALQQLTEDELHEEEEFLKSIDKELQLFFNLPSTPYAYVYPDYPPQIKLHHPEIKVLYERKNFFKLPKTAINKLLALPRESLINDLNQLILYELYKYHDGITDDMCTQYVNSVTHVLFLLGELKATESLPFVLELLRQNEETLEFLFGISQEDAFRMTLYYIGGNQLDRLLEFMKEPGLSPYGRATIFTALSTVAINEPERRAEVIEWFRKLIRFLIDHIDDNTVYDALLAGSLITALLDLNARELHQEIKELYDTKAVNTLECGIYEVVKEELCEAYPPEGDYSVLDIYNRYKAYANHWKNQ